MSEELWGGEVFFFFLEIHISITCFLVDNYKLHIKTQLIIIQSAHAKLAFKALIWTEANVTLHNSSFSMF